MILFLDLSYVATRSHVGMRICEKGCDLNQMLKITCIYYIA